MDELNKLVRKPKISSLKDIAEQKKEKIAETNNYKQSIASLGQWANRRFGGNEIKGEDYLRYKSGSTSYTGFKIKNVKRKYSGYWEEWEPIIDKVINFKYGTNKCIIKISSKDFINVIIEDTLTNDEADRWFETTFGSTIMNVSNPIQYITIK